MVAHARIILPATKHELESQKDNDKENKLGWQRNHLWRSPNEQRMSPEENTLQPTLAM